MIEDEKVRKSAWDHFLDEAELKEEIAEISDEFYDKTGYPVPVKSYRLILERSNMTLEQVYFWILGHIRQDQTFPYVYKLVDSFSASESSSLGGQTAQRLGIQQDKAGGYLRVISELIKQLFQIVRELRMIDEKLAVRKAWNEKLKSADVTLKGEFVELVEGGAKEVNSVYGLAREVGYSILPDLFFNTFIKKTTDIDEFIDKMDYNLRVKNVLKKKLYNFLNWKEHTDKEFESRREFELKYMYQHWQTIRTYMKWLSPYLRSIRRLSSKNKHIESADIISSFETSITEVEILGVRPIIYNGIDTGANACLLINFYNTSQPELSFHTPDYANKGAIHAGRVIVNMKAYAWTKKQIELYRKYKEEEDLELIGLADQKIQSAMDMLGDSFRKYLAECDPSYAVKDDVNKKKAPKQESILSPFLGIFGAFGELFGAFFPASEKKEKKIFEDPKKHLSNAAGLVTFLTWQTYKNYKKGNGLIAW